MHFTLCEMSDTPIERDDGVSVEEFEQNGFVGNVADYIEYIDHNRDSEIRSFLRALPYGYYTYDKDKESVVMHKGIKQKFFGDRVDKFKAIAKGITLADFTEQFDTKRYSLEKILNDHSVDYVYFHGYGNYMTFDDFVRVIEEEKTYYFGELFDFHR